MNMPAHLSKALCALVLPLAFILSPALLLSTPAQGPPSAQSNDLARLERIEELSESLANDLLELSVAVRDRDIERVTEFFPARFSATPFLSRPLPVKNETKWIGNHAWVARDESLNSSREKASKNQSPRDTNRRDFMREWSSFLDHFTEIEDARFKVKEANFDDKSAAGRARIAFYVIGRDTGGRREWARGVAHVVARQSANKRWQFQSFLLTSLDSQVASADIFSEVSVPAKVDASRPAYGSEGNTGFVWHGAAAADFNRDGWIDLFVTAPNRNYLYLNDRQGRFRDASDEAGVKLLASGAAPLILDYDNDGDEDVFISAVGSQVLLENRLAPDGKLTFFDVSLEAGVSTQAIGFSAIAGDVNGDGYLDIYVTCYNRYGQITPDSWFRATNGTANLLFINQRNGSFREEGAKWGVDDRRWSYAAEFADVNGDGRLDLYVANDFGEKGLFINKGDRFVDEARDRGALDPGNGMGVSFGDYNNDGLLDLHATNMSSTAGNRILSRLFPNAGAKDNVLKKLAAGNNLYRNAGDGSFHDVTAEVGGFSGGWAWGGGFVDFDNDGWEDIYTPNGFISGKTMKDT